MSGPLDGKYLIVFSPPPGPPFPSPPVGVKKSSEPVLPVITGGSDNVFTIKKYGDKYNILLPNPDPLFRVTGVEGDDVVALTILSSADPIEFTPWNIFSESDGTYVISKPNSPIGAIQCWTVEKPGPDQPVILKSYPVYPGMVLPQWEFIPSIIPQ